MSNNCIIDDNKTSVPIEIPKTQLDLNFDSFIEALTNGFNLDTVSLESERGFRRTQQKIAAGHRP